MSRQLRDVVRVVLAVAGLVLAVGGSSDAFLVPQWDVAAGALLLFAAYASAQAEVKRYRSHLGSRHEKGEDEGDADAEKRRRKRAKPKR